MKHYETPKAEILKTDESNVIFTSGTPWMILDGIEFDENGDPIEE